MTINTKTVKGVKYLYFTYYNQQTKRKKEIYCGPKENPESYRKASELERSHIENRLVTLENQLVNVDLENSMKQEETTSAAVLVKGIDWRLEGEKVKPYYATQFGAAYLGDSLKLMENLDENSVDLIVTSVPFALLKKKEYGNEDANNYVNWFEQFAEHFWRILKSDGNLIIHIGGAWNKGEPTKSLYTYQLLLALCSTYKHTFKLAQDFYWYNPAKLPSPAEWVTVRRVRVKDAVDFVWWLSKSSNPKADNRRVLKLYSQSMRNLLRNGYKAKVRPSGHDISTGFNKDYGGAIPSNLLTPSNLLAYSNTDSNSKYLSKCREYGIKVHPARFPEEIPEFFIRFLSNPDSKVLDPFGGSNVTGYVAESFGRSWMAFETNEEYVIGSMFRFRPEQILVGNNHIRHLRPVVKHLSNG